MSPQEFLLELMRRSGDNPHSLSAKLKNATKQPQIYKFLEGIAKEPRRSTLQPVAEFYGVSVEAFYSAEVAERELARVESGVAVGREDGHYIIRGAPKEKEPDWPFDLVDHDQYLALPEASKYLVQVRMRDAIEEELRRLYAKQETPKKAA